MKERARELYEEAVRMHKVALVEGNAELEAYWYGYMCALEELLGKDTFSGVT